MLGVCGRGGGRIGGGWWWAMVVMVEVGVVVSTIKKK